MTLFGFNISRSRPTPPAPHSTLAPSTRSLSPTAAAWLAGEDLNAPPKLTNAYQQVPWVYRAINAVAEQVANVPFLFSSGDRGRENLITRGPLLDFYSQPHPHINQFQYWELRLIWLMLRGECFRIPVFEHGKLARIVILDPANFQHIIK